MKPLSQTERALPRSVTLLQADYDIAQRIASGNFSKGVRLALRFYAANNQLPELAQETFEESKHV
jgi:hypothetical protein